MAIEEVLHMNGGVGDTSYANNSSFQRNVMLTTKHILEDSIIMLYCATFPNCLKVADLGCSSGPNALLVASNIINTVDAVRQNLNLEPPAFQFFLNDLFGNDFNTTFKLLPYFYKRLEEEKGHNFGPCFFSGTPGSFYGRLFPNDSVHFFHSSYSLHWLSKCFINFELVAMAIEEVLHMNGGVGDTSYANNSSFQRNVMLTTKHILEDSIIMLYCATFPNCLKVADLGCSSGPNALLVASNIINTVDAVRQNLNLEPPAFQFFLNDLFGNDFNTTFKLLPYFYKRLEEEKGHNFGPCLFSGTPGSFYGRLFPNDSVHFFHSSYSLHWLSKTPDELTGAAEPLNKGAIYLTKTSPPAVHKAYFAQFQEDFNLFLRSRSCELLPGGAMAITLIGRDENNELINAWVVIGMALNDMASENLIEKAKLDSFNIPSYCPTAEEIRQVIEEEGSFDIQRLETIRTDWTKNINVSDDIDEDKRAQAVAKYIRAVAEPILKAEFGEAIMDELFHRFKNKIVKLHGIEKLELANLVMHMTKST